MFQDCLNTVYHNEYQTRVPQEDDVALVYCGGAIYALVSSNQLILPHYADLSDGLRTLPCRFGFYIGQTAYDIISADSVSFDSAQLVSGTVYRNLDPDHSVFAAAVGHSLHRWYRANRFCGRCGTQMQDSTTERAMVCPDCGLTVYPKICPAVIVAVTDGDRLLLTRYKDRPFKRYALVAGFNEIGESIEDTVRREVMEEVGLKVTNLRFYKSQPWVFTDSLLMGFFCDLDGDGTVTLQEDELAEAEWFDRSDLPDDHSGISLTGEMIEVFRNQQGENAYDL